MYPRQIEDMKSVKAAIHSFDKDMNKMMLLMKELGTTLEGVSRSFDALTSLSFSNKDVKAYVHRFAVEITRMKEGAPYQNYNKRVYEDVLAPVQNLKKTLKETQATVKKRDAAYERYDTSKKKVDKTERKYAKENKSLEASKTYPAEKAKRERLLEAFRATDQVFQTSFQTLVQQVETVATETMKQYLSLNAGYMASVTDALTSTDPSIEEAVALYRHNEIIAQHTALARDRLLSGGGGGGGSRGLATPGNRLGTAGTRSGNGTPSDSFLSSPRMGGGTPAVNVGGSAGRGGAPATTGAAQHASPCGVGNASKAIGATEARGSVGAANTGANPALSSSSQPALAHRPGTQPPLASSGAAAAAGAAAGGGARGRLPLSTPAPVVGGPPPAATETPSTAVGKADLRGNDDNSSSSERVMSMSSQSSDGAGAGHHHHHHEHASPSEHIVEKREGVKASKEAAQGGTSASAKAVPDPAAAEDDWDESVSRYADPNENSARGGGGGAAPSPAAVVGGEGVTPPLVYNFGRGPNSQVSSVAPRSGYIAAQQKTINAEFMKNL